jgi:uncharacterized protein
MLVDVNKISEQGLSLNNHLDLDNKYLIDEGGVFLDSLHYDVSLLKSGDHIKVKGTINTAVSLRCVRCLENFEMQVDSNFDIILFPMNLIEVNNLHLEDEDMEYIFFEGDKIDIDKILIEQVNFFIPYNPLCKENCKGLCPVCGVNLNREECKCDNSFKELSLLLDKIKR